MADEAEAARPVDFRSVSVSKSSSVTDFVNFILIYILGYSFFQYNLFFSLYVPVLDFNRDRFVAELNY